MIVQLPNIGDILNICGDGPMIYSWINKDRRGIKYALNESLYGSLISRCINES